MKRSGLSMAAMVATVVMVLTVSTYAITARTVNPVVGLSFQGTTAVCHAKCFAGSDNDNIQATLTLYCGANRLDSWDGSGKGTISLSGTCRVETGKQYKLTLTYSINGNMYPLNHSQWHKLGWTLRIKGPLLKQRSRTVSSFCTSCN